MRTRGSVSWSSWRDRVEVGASSFTDPLPSEGYLSGVRRLGRSRFRVWCRVRKSLRHLIRRAARPMTGALPNAYRREGITADGVAKRRRALNGRC